MHGPFLGEFMGTLVLILLGENQLALDYLERIAGQPGSNAGWALVNPAMGDRESFCKRAQRACSSSSRALSSFRRSCASRAPSSTVVCFSAEWFFRP